MRNIDPMGTRKRRARRDRREEPATPPPKPMTLTVESRHARWQDLSCNTRLRVTGGCHRCEDRSQPHEHVVTSGSIAGYFCDRCCPVCVENFHVEYSDEQKSKILSRFWGLRPNMVLLTVETSQSQLALLDAIRR